MVHERFNPSRTSRHPERLAQHLPQQPPVRRPLKAGIETQHRPRTFETIAREIQFFHRVHILAVQFRCWAVGRFREPEVEVFAFAGFEEENVIAVVEVGEFV